MRPASRWALPASTHTTARTCSAGPLPGLVPLPLASPFCWLLHRGAIIEQNETKQYNSLPCYWCSANAWSMSIKICFPSRKKKSQTRLSISQHKHARKRPTLEKKEEKNPKPYSFVCKLKCKQRMTGFWKHKTSHWHTPSISQCWHLTNASPRNSTDTTMVCSTSNLVLTNAVQLGLPNSFLPSKRSHRSTSNFCH